MCTGGGPPTHSEKNFCFQPHVPVGFYWDETWNKAEVLKLRHIPSFIPIESHWNVVLKKFARIIFVLTYSVTFLYELEKNREKYQSGVSRPAESESEVEKSKKNHFNYLYLQAPPLGVVSLIRSI